MAVVLPFAALRYDQQKVGSLEQVLTQPYDKISPEMQRDYLRRSPYNLVRLIKGEVKPEDTPSENVYTRAAGWLREWRRQGVLVEHPAPAYYAYHQQFTPPGSIAQGTLIRKGFIGLGKLEPYDNGVIFRHEQTLTAPKADRLDLLRATRTHLESIFMLYSDPERKIEAILDRTAARPATAEVSDEYGVAHRLWDVEDAAEIERLRQAMADKNLIIADGHHRYETALNFERECRATHTGRDTDCSMALMTFVNMDGEGILILPTHRLVASLEGWDANSFLKAAEQYFSITRLPFSSQHEWRGAEERLLAQIEAKPGTKVLTSGTSSVGALFHGDNAFYCLTQRPEIDWEKLLPELTPAQRSLDVTVLHRIVFARCLGMDEEAVRKEKYLSYVRQFEEGVESVLKGASQACFFLSPVKIEQVREIAFSGRVLPQKSTDFYPKLLSGLVLYSLNH
jgi:uncharacterized protein (DUF1015 family)